MYKKILNNLVGNQPNLNVDTKIINQLMKQPLKESRDDIPKFQNFVKNNCHQADLLFLPSDRGYKYLLVVVDISSRLIDAEKLKDKNATSIVKAFKKNYDRDILEIPHNINFDAGKEFHGETKQYFENLDVNVHYADPNRHRQQGIVESANQRIGKIIFMMQSHQELQTKKQCKVWVKFIKQIIDELNEDSINKNKTQTKEISTVPIITENNKNILNINDKVRVKLDHPIDVYNKKKIGGNFRAGDIKWTINVYKIKEVLLRPGFPPMYLTTKSKTTQYTTQQLQVIK